jgi:CO dehydrogenase/acetyl-CoA synthase beta subunit
MTSQKLQTVMATLAALKVQLPRWAYDDREERSPDPEWVQDKLITASDAKKARKNAKRLKLGMPVVAKAEASLTEEQEAALQELADLSQEHDLGY